MNVERHVIDSDGFAVRLANVIERQDFGHPTYLSVKAEQRLGFATC